MALLTRATVLWRRHAREAGRYLALAARHEALAGCYYDTPGEACWASGEDARWRASRCRDLARRADARARDARAALLALLTAPAAPGGDDRE